MFESARAKLTIFYLIIIMAISVLFSVLVYRTQVSEAERVLETQQQRFGRMPGFRGGPALLDPTLLEDYQSRVLFNLMFINFAILAAAGAASYFLAGRTLRPIEEMVGEQHRFVSDASHELRTPLAAMQSEIEVALRDPKLTTSSAKEVLRSNLEELATLKHLSENLLNLSKNEEIGLNMSQVSLTEVARAAKRRVTSLAKDKKITLELPAKNHRLRGDPGRLTDLFVILLDNAIKYSPQGGTVAVTAQKNDGQLAVTFADQGAGVPLVALPHIFDRFYRGETSRSKDKPGFGLGLAIAKKIVTAHGGTIEAHSITGKGSQFVVRLPV